MLFSTVHSYHVNSWLLIGMVVGVDDPFQVWPLQMLSFPDHNAANVNFQILEPDSQPHSECLSLFELWSLQQFLKLCLVVICELFLLKLVTKEIMLWQLHCFCQLWIWGSQVQRVPQPVYRLANYGSCSYRWANNCEIFIEYQISRCYRISNKCKILGVSWWTHVHVVRTGSRMTL